MALVTVQVIRRDIRAFTSAAVFGCRTDEIGNMERWLVKRWPFISRKSRKNGLLVMGGQSSEES